MRRITIRFVSNALAAVAGAAFGNALHQRLRGAGDAADAEPPVAVPVVPSVAATLAGVIAGTIFGRRGWIVAFGFGVVSSALIGRALDRRMLPSAQPANANDTSSSHSSE